MAREWLAILANTSLEFNGISRLLKETQEKSPSAEYLVEEKSAQGKYPEKERDQINKGQKTWGRGGGI